jgi:hypothetical protein
MQTLRRERKQRFEVILLEEKIYPTSTDDRERLLTKLLDAAESRSERKTDETKGKYIAGIEAAIWQGRPVTEADLLGGTESLALQAFERDMQLPASWEWYPAKQTKEREWRLLREFVVKTYAADPKAFEKYNTWRNQPYVKGAKSNTQIKDYPADFEVSWSDFLRANPQTTDRPEYQPYVEEKKNYVPRPKHLTPNIPRQTGKGNSG